MGTARRYIPRGYLEPEKALQRIAKIRHPAHWGPGRVSPEEAQVYDELGRTLDAELLQEHLHARLKRTEFKEEDSLIVERFADYQEAVDDLRAALHANELCAEYVDESGRFGAIPAARWGADDGRQSLLRGVICLDEGDTEVSRLALLKIKDVEKFARQPTTGVGHSNQGRPSISDAKARDELLKFRESRGGSIPTEKEEVAYLRALGVSRQRARKIRGMFKRLSRGRPKRKA
jgi:hypothetical protein